MSSAVCAQCGGSDIDFDQARGDAVCMNCGSVLEDQIIVSEVQFEENSRGGANVIGQYVSAEGNKSHSLGSGFHHGIGRESRMITLQNGQKKIKQLGAVMKLNHHCIDTAYNFFKMAVNKRLTRGRKTSHVITACLYLVCRTEGTPHMLLDFADVLQTNVHALGRTYLQLAKELCINIPALDPCLYIDRFAHKLEFEEKTHEVAETALRLVSRMKRDWMAQGRRPSGLCGAALLVAARIHNFNRTIKEIIKVVRIGEGTIRKRLSEFEQTPSGALTVDEFQNQKIDLESEADPPSYTEGKRKAKIQQLEEEGQLPQLQAEVQKYQKEIEKAMEEVLSKKHRRYGKNAVDSSSVCSSSPSVSDLDEELTKFLEEESLKNTKIGEEVLEILNPTKNLITPGNNEDSNSSASNCSNNVFDSSMLPISVRDPENRNLDLAPPLDFRDQDKDPDVAKMEQAELESFIMPPPSGILGPRPTAASLGIRDTVEECLKAPEDDKKEEESGELDLTDIDDEEIEKFILSEAEVRRKTIMWMKANTDYLREQKEKAEREAKEREEEALRPEKKKKRQVRKKGPRTEASSAGEAIEKMLVEKKISSKINYEVLRDLNKVSPRGGASGDPGSSPLGPGVLEATPVNLRSPGRFRRTSSSSSASQDSNYVPIKRPRPTETISSRIVQHQIIEKPTASKSQPDVIVESGPVVYVPADEQDQEEDDYYVDEEEPVSAAQLMGHSDLEDYEQQEEDEYID